METCIICIFFCQFSGEILFLHLPFAHFSVFFLFLSAHSFLPFCFPMLFLCLISVTCPPYLSIYLFPSSPLHFSCFHSPFFFFPLAAHVSFHFLTCPHLSSFFSSLTSFFPPLSSIFFFMFLFSYLLLFPSLLCSLSFLYFSLSFL